MGKNKFALASNEIHC